MVENTFACMKAAYDVGINFFDCAEGYSGGESERVMGQAIKKFAWKRNDLVVSTKVCECATCFETLTDRTRFTGEQLMARTQVSKFTVKYKFCS